MGITPNKLVGGYQAFGVKQACCFQLQALHVKEGSSLFVRNDDTHLAGYAAQFKNTM